MKHRPGLDEFRELARTSTMVPVYRRLTSDTLTPLSAYCKVQEGDCSFLLESVVGGERVGRYSFIGAGPFLRFEAFDKKIRVQDISKGERAPTEFEHPDPLKWLEEKLSEFRAPHLPELPRFCGGAVGYAAYDSVRYLENLPNAPTDDRHLPDLSFAFYDRMVIFDQINKTVLVVVHAHVDAANPEAGYHEACTRVDRLVERLQQGVADLQVTDIDPKSAAMPQYRSNFTQAEFEAAVEKCKEYIFAGDIFQVVLSQRFQAETKARPLDIYRALRVLNPSPFMFLLRTGPLSLIGASPEIMVRAENGKIVSRPLAGTRRRGATEEEDNALAEELLADPKERAEHIMLVDLARNDVGRVSQFGSVRLQDLMTVERYSHVMHISSTVTGDLLPDKTPIDALRMSLPAGTLSGAPKVRAMQVIDELEPHRRGPYGGGVGYIDFCGNMDTCIALRTMVMLGQTAYVQAGAGIVADSVPEMEYQETVNKAMGLLRALGVAEQQL